MKVYAIVDFVSILKDGTICPFETKQCFIGTSKKNVLDQIKQNKKRLQQRCDDWDSGHTIRYGKLIEKDKFETGLVEYERVCNNERNN